MAIKKDFNEEVKEKLNGVDISKLRDAVLNYKPEPQDFKGPDKDALDVFNKSQEKFREQEIKDLLEEGLERSRKEEKKYDYFVKDDGRTM